MTSKLPQEIAFYYPGHIWREADWIKSLLLFFDGVGLLIPEYKKGEPERLDPVLAGPLRDQGLLHYLVADQVVDRKATRTLAKTVGDLIAAGSFDKIDKTENFHSLSMSRLGYEGDRSLGTSLFEEFKRRGLAKDTEDGVSFPIHPLVRYLVLTLLAQILRSSGPGMGMDLCPATDRPEVVEALTDFLSLPKMPSAGHVVAFDLQTVSVDLSSIPLEEVLSFRAEHGREHREYMRSIRAFAREIGLLPLEQREEAFRDRQGQLEDMASDLRKRSRAAWRKPASFGLSLVGAAWNLVAQNFVGAAVGAGNAFIGIGRDSANQAGAFSYLFSARQRFGY